MRIDILQKEAQFCLFCYIHFGSLELCNPSDYFTEIIQVCDHSLETLVHRELCRKCPLFAFMNLCVGDTNKEQEHQESCQVCLVTSFWIESMVQDLIDSSCEVLSVIMLIFKT